MITRTELEQEHKQAFCQRFEKTYSKSVEAINELLRKAYKRDRIKFQWLGDVADMLKYLQYHGYVADVDLRNHVFTVKLK